MDQQAPSLPRVVLSDDHTIVRHAIKTVIESSRRFSVIGEADDAASTLEIVQRTRPDLLVLDLSLPGKSGLEVLYELKQRGAAPKVVVLTMYDDEHKMAQAFAAGARAYLVKDSSPADLLAAFDCVLGGGLFVAPRHQHLLERFSSVVAQPSYNPAVMVAMDPLGTLSDREREIFYLLADGLPNRTIAKRLFISPRTVETHRARILKKLSFSSTADLVRYAIRNNLLTV